MEGPAVGERGKAERRGEAQPREQVADHRIGRPEASLGEHHPGFGGMPRAQQVEARNRLAHQPERPAVLPAGARGHRLTAQIFLALDDLLQPPRERVLGPERLPHRQKHRHHRQRGERGDGIVGGDAGGQPAGDPQILRLHTDHISNRAIRFMMATPLTSMATATPSRK